MRCAIASSACVLADDALVQRVCEVRARCWISSRDHLADGNAGPARDDLGDRLARRRTSCTSGVSPCSAASSARLRRARAQRRVARRRRRRAAARLPACRGASSFVAQLADLVDELLLLLPARLERRRARASAPRVPLAQLREPLGVVGAGRGSRARGCRSRRRGASIRRRQSSSAGGHRALADRDAGAGRVEQARPPCRAAGGRGCSGARAGPRSTTPRRGCAPCGASRASRRGRASCGSPSSSSGSSTLIDLEAPRQRRVLLEVLLVLGPGRGRDRAQLAARQRRLEQVGRVALAGRRRRRRSACAPRR